MAAILGLADEAVENLCQKIAERVAGELQLPRPARDLRRDARRSTRPAPRRSARARAARSGCASRARSTRRSSRTPASVLRPGDREGRSSEGRARVHVDGDGEARGRAALPLAADRAADRAGAVHAVGARADRPRRHDLRGGGAGQRAERFTEEDRQLRSRLLRSAISSRSTRLPRRLANEPAFASLEGRLALVTGGSRGIGRAIAEELARAGAQVVVGYRSGADEAEELAAEIGGRAVQADVSSPEDAKRLVDEAGDVDVLVNNAGLTRDGLLARMSDDDWRDGDRDEPQLGLLHLPRRDAADDEEARRARSSTSARSSACTATGARRTTPPRRPGSSASRSRWRASSARADVRANVVAPGYVKTRLTEVLPEEATEAMLENTPLGRLGEPEDVAGAVRFLCLRRGVVHHRRRAARRRRAGDVDDGRTATDAGGS